MFKIAEFRAAEKALAKQLAAFEELKNNAELRRELEFDKALDKFLAEHLMNRAKLQAFLTMQGFPPRLGAPVKAAAKAVAKPAAKAAAKPGPKAAAKPAKGTRLAPNKSPAKVYKNPHNGESITVKRVDHGVLQRWVAEHGKETVDTWLVA
jgi:hypothetical protein